MVIGQEHGIQSLIWKRGCVSLLLLSSPGPSEKYAVLPNAPWKETIRFSFILSCIIFLFKSPTQFLNDVWWNRTEQPQAFNNEPVLENSGTGNSLKFIIKEMSSDKRLIITYYLFRLGLKKTRPDGITYHNPLMSAEDLPTLAIEV